MNSIISFVLAAACLCTPAAASQPPCRMPSVSAECAIVAELETGRVIAAKNADRRAGMASTTKIMTALILCESGRLEEEITVTADMLRVEGSSMGLLAGDRVHLKDLLYGMMLASGNDAANVTAITLGGSLSGFAEMMNAKAAELGMTDTHFVTPSGLWDELHYTTAADMVRLTVAAMKNPQFAAAAGSRSAVLEYGNPPYRRTLTNHNRLLSSYEGAIGVKTGFTKKTGRCLVSCAKRDGVGVIAVTLRAPNDWEDHRAMLDAGFAALSRRTLPTPQLPQLPVMGTGSKLSLSAEQPQLSLLPQDFTEVSYECNLPPFVTGPIVASQTVGSIKYYLGGTLIATVDITAENSVDVQRTTPNRSYLGRLIAMLAIK